MWKIRKKRVVMDSHQSQFINEKEARFRFKHQTLMQDYLELQKELISKKKKLRTAIQKRKFLLAEVRFLRQRHRYLMKIQSHNLGQGVVPQENSSMQKEVVEEPLKVEKKIKNCLINNKRIGKKKNSWQNQVVLDI